MATEVNPGVVAASLANASIYNDSQQLPQPIRLDRRLEQIVENLYNGMEVVALEGSYFVAQTPTPGTGIVLTSATGTTYSDTNSILGVNNLSAAGGPSAKFIILDYIKLIITAAGTAGTDSHVNGRLDIGAGVTAGTVLTKMNVNGLFASGDEVADWHAGAVTTTAKTNQARIMGRAELRKAAAPCYIVGDQIYLRFGVIEGVAAQAITPTTAAIVVIPMPPVVIPPGWSWVLNEWMAGRTAAQSAEVEIGYIVR